MPIAGGSGGTISTPLTNLPHLPRTVLRARLKSILTGLALYAMAAAIVGYFGVNAYTGKYGLNARQELDQEIVALTSELAQLKPRACQERAARSAAALCENRSRHAGRAALRRVPARLRQSARSRPDDPRELTHVGAGEAPS